MDKKIVFDICIYKSENNSLDLEVFNLKKECIKIFKFNDNKNDLRYVCQIAADIYESGKYKNTILKQVIFDIEKDDWNIDGHEEEEEEISFPSKYSVDNFFCEKNNEF